MGHRLPNGNSYNGLGFTLLVFKLFLRVRRSPASLSHSLSVPPAQVKVCSSSIELRILEKCQASVFLGFGSKFTGQSSVCPQDHRGMLAVFVQSQGAGVVLQASSAHRPQVFGIGMSCWGRRHTSTFSHGGTVRLCD